MSDDILAVHVWARGTPLAGQKCGESNITELKAQGLVQSYHGTPAELQSLSNNCNLTKRGPNAAFDASLAATLRQVAEESAAPIVVPMKDEDDEEAAEATPKRKRR